MMHARWHAFATFLLLVIPGVGLCETYVTGTTFSLPPAFQPITETIVEVRLYRPQPNAGRTGELSRDANGNLIPDGDPISTANTDIATGAYHLRIPVATGASEIFIIRFNRRNEAVTQDLTGVVLTDQVPAQYDVVVPKALPPACCNNCSRGGFLSRLRCRR